MISLDRSEYYKERYRKQTSTPEGRDAYRERKRREAKARYDTTQSAEYERDRKRRWRAENPDKCRRLRDAHHAVEFAILDGRITRPLCCSDCGKSGDVEAHHHRGYAPEHHLDVIWLCTVCHGARHHKRP